MQRNPYENQLIESYRILQNSTENFKEWVYRKLFQQNSIENVIEWVYRKLFQQNSIENDIEWVYGKLFQQNSIENVIEWVCRKLFLQKSIESIRYLSLFLFFKNIYRNSYILTLIQMMRVHEKPFYTKTL